MSPLESALWFWSISAENVARIRDGKDCTTYLHLMLIDEALKKQPLRTQRLYRSESTWDEWANVTPGTVVNVLLTSWSELVEWAAYYAAEKNKPKSVLLVMVGKSRSLPTGIMEHKEHITRGRFRVVSVCDRETTVVWNWNDRWREQAFARIVELEPLV